MRKLLLLLLPLTLALAACGGGGSAIDSDDPLGSAAENTIEAGSQKMKLDGKVTFGGQTIGLTGEGAFDHETEKGRLALTLAIPNAGEAPLEEVYEKGVVWLKSPLFASALPAGKEWVKVDVAKAGDQVGFNFKAVMGQTPADVLARLQDASTTVSTVGTEDIDGVETTHYRAEIDLDKLLANPDQKVSDAVYKPLDVWVDDEGRVRRVKLDYTAKIDPNQQDRAHTELTMDLYDFGVDVAVALPPAKAVVDASAPVGG